MRVVNAWHVDPQQVRYGWSYADLLEAHLTLDALDEVKLIYRPELPKKRKKGRR